jgi:hypothetical protein
MIPVKVIKTLPHGYQIPDPLPWPHIAGPLAAAEDALARLDERLATSPLRAGWIARTHYSDAAASLWLEGELVHLDDLVLHDANMDLRAPTHELIRAHAVLRARRRIAEASAKWALSPSGLASLAGRRKPGRWVASKATALQTGDAGQGEFDEFAPDAMPPEQPEGRFADAFAAVDAAMARTERRLADELRYPERNSLLYDEDWNENERLSDWQRIIEATRALPPTLAAALAFEAWESIEPLQHTPWLGRLLTAALLRDRGKTQAHLACLNVGLRAVPREHRRARDPVSRLTATLAAIAAAANAGLKDHDRWATAHILLVRKLAGRRSTSRLPALLDYVMTRPIVSAAMIAKELCVTSRAAQNLVTELGLREVTGRGRYRAWGIA